MVAMVVVVVVMSSGGTTTGSCGDMVAVVTKEWR